MATFFTPGILNDALNDSRHIIGVSFICYVWQGAFANAAKGYKGDGIMHSTIFILSENPISEDYVFDEDGFISRAMERPGYDYCNKSSLEYEVKDYFSGYYKEFFKTEMMKIEDEEYPEDSLVQFKMTISKRDKFIHNLYEEYRKALEEFSDVLTLERLLDSEDREISYRLYNLRCVMENKYDMQFYSDYGDFESPQELAQRSNEGDVYYIIAAFDYHF